MKNLLKFIKNLFYKPKKIYSIKDMDFIKSEIDKEGNEKIIHGNSEAQIEITIKRNENLREGKVTIQSDTNISLSEEDIIWLMKKYI